MANAEHVRKLQKEGIDGWNTWRLTEPNIKPDLSNADLSNANLNRVIFISANLSGTCLRKADLRNASLIRADLSGAVFGSSPLNSYEKHRFP